MAEDKVDLNRATKEKLMQVKGISDSTADNIIAYREENGGFDSIDELDEVRGFNQKTIDAIRDQVTVGEYEGEEEEEGEYEDDDDEEEDPRATTSGTSEEE